MLHKVGELTALSVNDVQTVESVVCEYTDEYIHNKFAKFASTLKRVAPKADEFLYFSAVMMHAAEAVLVNPDGSPKLTSKGEKVEARWDVNEKTGSWKWICNDPTVLPYKNSNGDIFPSTELLKAYKNWTGKPLCVDHKSNSVDAIRGIILDTFYDRKTHKVMALCALDKVSYPELAKKVSLGYSTSVSMGTAVGQAICSDCGQVARTEHEFCQHMRTKSCYGEINVGLQPIELSIVVNGADPQAKIRTIIAAANTVNNHLAAQEQELLKNTANTYNAELLQQVKDALHQCSEKVAELDHLLEQDENHLNAPYGQSSGQINPPADETDQASGLNLPERLAVDGNNDALLSEVRNLRASLEQRLFNLEQHLKEGTMSDQMNKEAYWQGGGGVNEPTPGQKKYPVDPTNEKLRLSEDKQMVGQKPFPDVGAVDGLHPSPESVEIKDELERKKMLARAEQEERSMRRSAALEQAKKAYFQGGGGVNEPAPKQVKYPKDPMNEQLRANEDKQMVGQKPFPDVGAVDGLHPSPESVAEKDELERKKMLQRASLKARFIRAANVDGTDNLGKSGWQVYAKSDNGDKLLFAASVDEISRGQSDVLFDVIATKEFGSKMLEKIRHEGLEKAASLYKKSQAVAEPGAMPAAPPDTSGNAPVPALPEPAADKDNTAKGDPKETALKLADQAMENVSDLKEAIHELTGEQPEMSEMSANLEALPKAAASVLLPLNQMRKELNAGLLSGMKKAVAELNDHVEELKLIVSAIDAGTVGNEDYFQTLIEDAFEDAKKAIADAHSLKDAFVKYAQGTAGLAKRAEAAMMVMGEADENDARKAKKPEKSSDEEDSDEESSEESSDESSADDNAHMHMHDHDEFAERETEPMLPMDERDTEPMLPMEEEEDLEETLPSHKHEMMDANDAFNGLVNEADDNATMVELPPGAPMPAGAKAVATEKKANFDLSTKEGRAAYRAKLAADATGKEDDGEVMDMSKAKYSDMLDQADSLANGQTQLDTKPSDDLGRVETPEEMKQKMMEVAKAPPKVRKEAERLQQLIAEGTVKSSDLDNLIAQGLDPEVVKYWRQFYGEAGKEGSEFAKLLTQETMKAKMAEEMQAYRVKIARAFELSNEMVRRGLLANDRAAINAQVDEVMKWNDEAFDSMNRVIAKHAPLSFKKEASLPQTGLIGSGEMYSQQSEALDFQSELERAFSVRRY